MTVLKSAPIRIGIRPTIDGRRMGVRESLEDQTMNMAKSVANLLESHIRHTDGSFVECVIADTCIGGVAEAAACAEKFKLANVGAVITVTPCWCYGSETIDMDPHMPKAIWGIQWHRTPRCCLFSCRISRPFTNGLTCLFYLWHRSARSL